MQSQLPDAARSTANNGLFSTLIADVGWVTINAVIYSLIGWGIPLFCAPLLVYPLLVTLLPGWFWLQYRTRVKPFKVIFWYFLLWLCFSICIVGFNSLICQGTPLRLFPTIGWLGSGEQCSFTTTSSLLSISGILYLLGAGVLIPALNGQLRPDIDTRIAEYYFQKFSILAEISGHVFLFAILGGVYIFFTPGAFLLVALLFGGIVLSLPMFSYSNWKRILGYLVVAVVLDLLVLNAVLNSLCIVSGGLVNSSIFIHQHTVCRQGSVMMPFSVIMLVTTLLSMLGVLTVGTVLRWHFARRYRDK